MTFKGARFDTTRFDSLTFRPSWHIVPLDRGGKILPQTRPRGLRQTRARPELGRANTDRSIDAVRLQLPLPGVSRSFLALAFKTGLQSHG